MVLHITHFSGRSYWKVAVQNDDGKWRVEPYYSFIRWDYVNVVIYDQSSSHEKLTIKWRGKQFLYSGNRSVLSFQIPEKDRYTDFRYKKKVRYTVFGYQKKVRYTVFRYQKRVRYTVFRSYYYEKFEVFFFFRGLPLLQIIFPLTLMISEPSFTLYNFCFLLWQNPFKLSLI